MENSALEAVRVLGILAILVSSLLDSGLPGMFTGALWMTLSKSFYLGSREKQEAVARAREASRVALSRARVSGANRLLITCIALALWWPASSALSLSWLTRYLNTWALPAISAAGLLLVLAVTWASELKLLQNNEKPTTDSLPPERASSPGHDATNPKSDQRPAAVAWIITGVSATAAVVAAAAAWNANTIAERTWADSGAAFSVTAGSIQYWGPIESFKTNGQVMSDSSPSSSPSPSETSKWTALSPDRTAAFDKVLYPNSAYAIVTLSNVGRTAGSIQTVGWAIGPSKNLSVQPKCEEEGSLVACTFPMKVDVAEAVKMYVPIDNPSLVALTCNPWVADNGLVVAMNETQPGSLRWISKVGIAQATYCETPRPEIQVPEA